MIIVTIQFLSQPIVLFSYFSQHILDFKIYETGKKNRVTEEN